MSGKLNEEFSAALREVLVAQVTAPPRRRPAWLTRPRRWVLGTGTGVLLGVCGGGLAYATGAFNGPGGGQITTPLAAPVTVAHEGTHVVELGTAPAGANEIVYTLVCLSPGFFGFPGGAGMSCTQTDLGHPQHDSTSYRTPLTPGQTSLRITAPARARWRLTAGYVSTATTPWYTNASGETYGIQNSKGVPDLISAVATNHRVGYVYANQLQNAANGGGPAPTTPRQAIADSQHGPVTIPVYESDGRTQIGVFTTDAHQGSCVETRARPHCKP